MFFTFLPFVAFCFSNMHLKKKRKSALAPSITILLSPEFKNLEKRINLDNLIYNYKTEGRGLKDFKNYQNPRVI